MSRHAAARVSLAIVIALSLGACATAPAPEPSLYERLGGRDAIAAVVDDALGNVAADDRINHRFSPAAIPQVRKGLIDLLCLRAGGPCVYTGSNMADAHEGMFIRDDEFDALMEDLVKSLDKFKVPAREQREALAALRQMRGAIVGH